MRLLAAASAALMACTLAGCSSDGEPSAPNGGNGGNGLTVSAPASNIFSPATLNVTVGQTVTWAFGPVDHNVTFNPVTGAPGNIGNTRSASVSRTFTTAGAFPYACTLHAGMTGTVNVSASGSSVPLY